MLKTKTKNSKNKQVSTQCGPIQAGSCCKIEPGIPTSPCLEVMGGARILQQQDEISAKKKMHQVKCVVHTLKIHTPSTI
jgi:hypothetical protein